jgi:3-oxoacyl-[acyl-carrier-protein] synthase III
MKYNIEKMAQDHEAMQSWHEQMAKSAADTMQDHIKAAAWHNSQADIIKAMMTDIPLDPEKKVTTIPTSGSAPTPTSPIA